jgi:aconitate hydratase
VRAVIAESYERIHRSNLVGMGILPLQFLPGENTESLKLTGEEFFHITGIGSLLEKFSAGKQITVRVSGSKTTEFQAIVRIDTPQEALYYANGGILQYVLRQLLAGKAQPEAVPV